MIRHSIAAVDRLARLALCLLASLTLVACGSGAVSGPPASSGPIAISPSSATLYSGLPTTFVITGGNGSYVITSSNQAVVNLSGLYTGGNALTVVPSDVASDTSVTLTVSDTSSAAAATAALTVKPRTISNVVTITPSASQSAACGSSICAGGDAEVKAVLSQGGVPIVGRTVRFDVVSGDFRIITSAPGAAETLALTGTAITDNTGTASIRIRVLSDASAQTGLLQVTDTVSGFTQRTSVSTAPSSNAPLNAQPSTIVFQGTTAGTCASGISADVIVFGGRPPYLVSQPGSFTVSPTVITSNGGRFTVTANGQCTAGSQIAIVDANGATVSVTASNKLSDLPVPTPTPTTTPVMVSNPPDIITCNSIANVTISGGTGTYFGTSSDSRVLVTVNGNVGSISLKYGTAPTAMPPSAFITFSDGKSSATVQINNNAATCP